MPRTVLAQESAAQDETDRERARKAYAAALTAFDHGQLDLAIDNFRLAQSLLPHETTAIAIAMVQERQGHYAEALETLESFFSEDKPRSPEVQAQVKRLQRMLPATLELTSSEPGWTILIDGAAEAGRTPTKIKVTPGVHRVELISPEGERVEKGQDLQAGKTYRIHGARRELRRDEDGANVAAWIFGGATLAALGTGIGFGIAALEAQSDYQTDPTQAHYDDTRRYSLVSDLAFAGAAVFAVGTLASLVLDSNDAEQPTRREAVLRIKPVASSQTVGILAHGVF